MYESYIMNQVFTSIVGYYIYRIYKEKKYLHPLQNPESIIYIQCFDYLLFSS